MPSTGSPSTKTARLAGSTVAAMFWGTVIVTSIALTL
jgi:hypothetical protein